MIPMDGLCNGRYGIPMMHKKVIGGERERQREEREAIDNLYLTPERLCMRL